ncbi:MAG: PAS domain-containing protein [Aquificaceae bacterium]
MRKPHVQPTNTERVVPEGKLIVSRTDLRGVITYANPVFIEISGYSEEELLGSPHSIVRHPDMPRTVFKVLWSHIQSGDECFAFVKNMAKDGSFYWVFGHVYPIGGGYQSDRVGVSKREILSSVIEPLYRKLKEIEVSYGLEKAVEYLNNLVKEKGFEEYNELILRLALR